MQITFPKISVTPMMRVKLTKLAMIWLPISWAIVGPHVEEAVNAFCNRFGITHAELTAAVIASATALGGTASLNAIKDVTGVGSKMGSFAQWAAQNSDKPELVAKAVASAKAGTLENDVPEALAGHKP